MNAAREIAAIVGSVTALAGVGMLSVPAMLIIGGVFLTIVAVRSGKPSEPPTVPAGKPPTEES